MSTRSSTSSKFRSNLFLGSLLLANPVVLFLLWGNALAAIALALLIVVGLQLINAHVRNRHLLVYIVNFLAIASLLCHAEVIFRYSFSDYVIPNLYIRHSGYYFNKPYLQMRFDDKEYSVDYITNIQGLRIGYSHNTDELITTADLLFLGDSFTQGAQVQFEELYTSRLYEHNPNRIIVNSGISGFGIVEALEYYRQAGHALNADVVVLQLSAFNDFMNVNKQPRRISDWLVDHSDFVRYLLQDIYYSNPESLPLGRWTEPFYPDVGRNIDYNVFYLPSSDIKVRDLAAFAEYIKLLDQEVQSNEAELVILFLPTKEQLHQTLLDEVVREFRLDRAQIDMRRPNHILQQLAKELDIRLIDLTELYDSSNPSPYFEYDEHLNRHGHQWLADVLANQLERDTTRISTCMILSECTGERYPMYSRDEQLMTFQAPRDGNVELFCLDVKTQSIQRLTTNDVDECHPMLSPDGKQVIFTEGDAEQAHTNVVIMDIASGRRETLTSKHDHFGAIPSYSADGSEVAYARWHMVQEDGRMTLPRIAILNRITGDEDLITPKGTDAWRPVFSPDSQYLAYIAKVDGQFDVFLHDRTSDISINITNTVYDEWDPQFSPEGESIVFSAYAQDNWDLFILDLNTRVLIQLTSSKGDEWDATITPSGDRILFAGHFGVFKSIYSMPLHQRSN